MLSIKECKALARENLIGRYGSLIGAYFITVLVSILLFLLDAACLGFSIMHLGFSIPYLNVQTVFSLKLFLLGILLFGVMVLATVIVLLWLGIGRQKMMLNICRGRKYSTKDLLYAFTKGSHPWNYIFVCLIIWLINVALWTLPRAAVWISGFMLGSRVHMTELTRGIIYFAFWLASMYVTVSFMFAKTIVVDKPEIDAVDALGRSFEMMKRRKLKAFWLLFFSFLFWMLLMSICHLASLWVLPYFECTKIIFYLDADGSIWQLPGAKKKQPKTVAAAPAEPAADPVFVENTEMAETVSGPAEEVRTEEVMNNAPAENEETVAAEEVINENISENTNHTESGE